ncbi:ABC transporter permease subunit [Rhizobium lusitanum]|uniref:ABC transporter permease subunit n=1 Tax=Rhizobium lusitanum TaxID=293958 RepID=A0A6L9UIQ8_9HYPH|nr:ABC transporter permease subunit [Rhizobium lusitanum]NEI74017.1 ABC transporter permease subunit [Rhizobium lusitanum]
MLQTITDFSSNSSPIDFVLILSQWQLFARGLLNTLILFVVTATVGGIVALPLGVARAYRVPVLSPIILCYTYVFRGTPLLVQTYMLYYGAGELDFVRDSAVWPMLREAWGCAFIAFSINTAAYVTEIICAGIRAVPSGEVEAAKACGMRALTRLRRILLPRAFRIMLPTYSNELIFALQATVVASTITIIDVLGAGRTLNGMYYLAYEGFLTAAVIYVCLTFGLARLFAFLEARLNHHLRPCTTS